MTYSKFHGWNLLDKELRAYFPDYAYKGIMLEIGAFEPIRLSNTFHFEQNGWDTYQFEANPKDIKLFDIRKNKCFNYAISNINKDNINFSVINSSGWTAGFSALTPTIPTYTNYPADIISVPVRTLDSFFQKELIHLNNKIIDIITIDVEGGELDVLKGLNMQRIRPKLLCVEDHNFNNSSSELHKYIVNQNYTFHKNNGLDSFYLSRD